MDAIQTGRRPRWTVSPGTAPALPVITLLNEVPAEHRPPARPSRPGRTGLWEGGTQLLWPGQQGPLTTPRTQVWDRTYHK